MKTYSSLRIERAIVLGFLLVILTGAFFIWLFGLIYSLPLSPLDALFTATSATCVTGLTVTDTAGMPVQSQVIVMLLIQLGGLGVMTVTTAMLMLLRQRVGVHEGLYLAGSLNVDSPSGAASLVLRVWGIALIVELLGACLLFFEFRHSMSFGMAVWYSIFHSISAFCNAGFALYSDNLSSYSQTILLPSVIMGLIVLGGMGYHVLYELCTAPISKRKMSPHAVLVLRMTGILIAAGGVLIFAAERQASLAELDGYGWKLWNSFFLSVSSRTAGFNTIPVEQVSSPGALIVIALMLIGASPGSTGGGLKTTTFALMCLSTIRHITGARQTLFCQRAITSKSVLMALTLAMLYVFVFISGGAALYISENLGLKEAFFEAASALGTVGLSLGVSPNLSSAGKWIVVLMMFLGRVGVLTFVFSLRGHQVEFDNVIYPEADIPIG